MHQLMLLYLGTVYGVYGVYGEVEGNWLPLRVLEQNVFGLVTFVL